MKSSGNFLGGAAHAARQGGQLLHQFLIVGAPDGLGEDSVVVDPSVIYKYPPDVPLVDPSLPLFCFPDGVRIKKLKRTTSNSRINEVRYSNLSALEGPRTSFCFLLTGLDHVLYGVCVHSEELLDDKPSLCLPPDLSSSQQQQPRLRAGSVRPTNASSSSSSTNAPSSYLSALRCYCLVSRFPFFRIHFDFLHVLLAKDRHVRMAGGGPHDAEQLVRAYLQQPIAEGSALQFQLPGDVHEFSFTLPAMDQDTLLGQWCSPVVMALPSDMLVMLVTALVLEYRVVVQSEHLGTLSSFVLGLIPLLKPFIWQGSFVPILPSSMAEALEAPVPFIFGIRGRLSDLPSASMLSPEDYMLVDVDKGIVKPPENMPRMPNDDQLRKKLQSKPSISLVNDFLKDIALRAEQFKCNWDEQDEVTKSIEKNAKPKERPFWARLFSSQLWVGHLGEQLNEKERQAHMEREAKALAAEKQRRMYKQRAETAVADRYASLINAERAQVKELEALIDDYSRKLTMAKERLEALLSSQSEAEGF